MIRTVDGKNWHVPLKKFQYANWSAPLNSEDKAIFDIGF